MYNLFFGFIGNISVTSDINLNLTSVVPEPEQWAMFLLGLPFLGWAVRGKSA